MKFPSLLAAAMLPAAIIGKKDSGFKYERLDKDDAVLLIVDIQEGLINVVRDFDPLVYHHQAIAHAAIAEAFDIPVVITTSADSGPNGPLVREIKEMHPNAPLIQRQGEINSWDSEEFRNAVIATNRTQVIIAGIVTDVCTTFLALSLREEGFSVWANVEASGTSSILVREVANDRMARAGVQTVSLYTIIAELMRDWRNVPGAEKIFPWSDKYMPLWGHLIRAHGYAVTNGTLSPGQEGLL